MLVKDKNRTKRERQDSVGEIIGDRERQRMEGRKGEGMEKVFKRSLTYKRRKSKRR